MSNTVATVRFFHFWKHFLTSWRPSFQVRLARGGIPTLFHVPAYLPPPAVGVVSMHAKKFAPSVTAQTPLSVFRPEIILGQRGDETFGPIITIKNAALPSASQSVSQSRQRPFPGAIFRRFSHILG